MRPLIVIQARMGSTRLPGKVLLPLGGKPSLQHTVERAQACGYLTVLACPVRDVPSLQQTMRLTPGFQFGDSGGEDDVLGRYHRVCGVWRSATHIIRLTGDCPLVEPDVIHKVVDALWNGASYASNTVERTYPRGLDVEGFTVELLEQAHREAVDPYDREHVTPWMQRHAPVTHIRHTTDLSQHRWCLDTAEDYDWLVSLFRRFSDPTLAQVLSHPPRYE